MIRFFVTFYPVRIFANRRVPQRGRKKEPTRDRSEFVERVLARTASDFVFRTGHAIAKQRSRADQGEFPEFAGGTEHFENDPETGGPEVRVGPAGQDRRARGRRVSGRHNRQPSAVGDHVEQKRSRADPGRFQAEDHQRVEQNPVGHPTFGRRRRGPVHVPGRQRRRQYELYDRRDRQE